jgi:hypothetical protein
MQLRMMGKLELCKIYNKTSSFVPQMNKLEEKAKRPKKVTPQRESLPVKSNTIISLVVNIDKCRIAFASINGWARPLVIYSKHALSGAQPCKIHLPQLQSCKTNNDNILSKTPPHTHKQVYPNLNILHERLSNKHIT